MPPRWRVNWWCNLKYWLWKINKGAIKTVQLVKSPVFDLSIVYYLLLCVFIYLSHFSTSYRFYSSVAWQVISCVDEISGGYQYGFWHNRWLTDQVLCTCQVLELEKLEYSGSYISYIWTSRKPMIWLGVRLHVTLSLSFVYRATRYCNLNVLKVKCTVKARHNVSIGTTVQKGIEWYVYPAHCGAVLGPWTWWVMRKWNHRQALMGWFCSEICKTWAVPGGLKAEYQK